MKKVLLAVFFAAILCVQLTAATPDTVMVVRNLAPEGGWGWLSFTQDRGDVWSGYPIGDLAFWGWGNDGNQLYNGTMIHTYDHLACGKWADFNGDGVADKVQIAPIVYEDPANPGPDPEALDVMQIAVMYSTVDGDIIDYWTNTSPFLPNGDNCLEWSCWRVDGQTDTNFSEHTFLPCDLNNDGFADNVVAMKQNYLIDPNAALLWNAYISDGTAGIPKYTGTGKYFNTGWQAFGQEKNTPAVGDINGDGYADRIIWEFQTWPVGDPAVDTVFIWAAVDYSDNADGDDVYFGDGFIDEYCNLSCGPASSVDMSAYQLRVTDINGDGLGDFAVAVAGNPDNAADTHFLYGWYTRPELLTGYAVDETDLPAAPAWNDTCDVKGLAGFSISEEAIEYCDLNAPAVSAVESVAFFRPESQWFVFAPDTENPDWIDGNLDQQANWGWSGVTADLADFNGDGVADKVLTQIIDGGQGNTALQTVVSYSDPDGDITGTSLDSVQINWDWMDAYKLMPIYGDVDGDGIADAGIVTDGVTAYGEAGNSANMVWGAWMSQGSPGVSYDFGSAVNHSGWNIFGDTVLHTPLMGDINGDGVDDRLIYDPATFMLHVDFGPANGGYGDGVIDQSAGVFGGAAGDQIALVDVNGDGYDDVVAIRDENQSGNDWFGMYVYYTDPVNGLDSADVDTIVNIGSPSLNEKPLFGVIPTPLSYCSLWDLNGDCTVDYRDFAVISESWLVPRGFLNESFEEPVLADGEYIQYGPGEDTMVGWTNNLLTADEYVRIVNPAESEVIQPAEGDNYILFSSWLTPGEDNIAQFEGGHENLGNSFHDIRIVPDTTYTVNVKVANPNLFEGAYNIQLVALDDFGEVLEINPLSVSSGNVGAGANWSTASVSWSSSENPEYVGDRLLFSMVGYDIIADDVVFIISGDYNRDGIIGIDDIAVLADRWLD
jgi:hypothetical protein